MGMNCFKSVIFTVAMLLFSAGLSAQTKIFVDMQKSDMINVGIVI